MPNRSDRALGSERESVLSEFNLIPVAKLSSGIYSLEVRSPDKLTTLLQQLEHVARKSQSFVVTWIQSREGQELTFDRGNLDLCIPS